MEKYRGSVRNFEEKLGFSPEDIIDIYTSYLADININIFQLELMLSQDNWTQIGAIVHIIKGMSGNVMLEDVFEQASELNNVLILNKDNVEKDRILKFIALLKSSQEKVRAVVKEYQVKFKGME